MADIIQLKRRTADAAAPSSLEAGEPAVNQNASGKVLYIGDGSNVKAYAKALDVANSVVATQASANVPALVTLAASQFVGRGATGEITNCTLGTGLAFTDAALGVDTSTIATKAYVDSVAQGLDPKQSVRAATAAAGTLATDFENGDTIDTSVTLVTGDRVLIKDQADATENGIYVVQASGTPVRAADLAAAASAAGAFVFVEEGTANADKGFVCTSNVGSDVVGTNNLAFSQFTGAGTNVSAGDTSITVTGGDTVSVNLATNSGLQVSSGLLLKVKANAGLVLDADGVYVNNTAADTQVVYMGANGLMTGEAAFAYVAATNTLTVGVIDGATIDGGTYT